MSEVTVREERPGDRAAVFRANEAAFGRADEARLVDAVRAAGEVGLSLVAHLGKRLVGHVLFSPVRVENNPRGYGVWGLGPIAVLPDAQNRGIGGSLVEAGLERCRGAGVAAVVVLGHSAYYPRFGFAPAARHDLYFGGRDVGDSFMVLELAPGALNSLGGAVHYPRAFG